jgi:MSHA pilin protein MshA
MEIPPPILHRKGFTLVEVIAVLIILGILGSVGTARVLDLRADARTGVVEGAFAAGSLSLMQEFARWLVDNPGASRGNEELVRRDDLVLGEFVSTLVLQCGSEGAYVEITGGPGWWPAAAGGFSARLFSDNRTTAVSSGGVIQTIKRTYTICD